jgi:hypothetical protein
MAVRGKRTTGWGRPPYLYLYIYVLSRPNEDDLHLYQSGLSLSGHQIEGDRRLCDGGLGCGDATGGSGGAYTLDLA